MSYDTPDTDEAAFGTGRVSVDFARRLERERDEARGIAAKFRDKATGREKGDPECWEHGEVFPWENLDVIDGHSLAPAPRPAKLECGTYRLIAKIEHLEADAAWCPIETAPKDGTKCFWWIVGKTEKEAYRNTSGEPILGKVNPHRHYGKYNSWNGLEKAILWRPDIPNPLPDLPREGGET